MKWRGMDLNHGPSGYAYHYNFRCLSFNLVETRMNRFVGLDCPFTLVFHVRVSAIQSLHLPKGFPLGLARDYRANDFPEFDR
jgi:hypothetical protein